jgi:hypothetical protein
MPASDVAIPNQRNFVLCTIVPSTACCIPYPEFVGSNVPWGSDAVAEWFASELVVHGVLVVHKRVSGKPPTD